ncbi:M20 family metallo-hydrolase [Klebsiella pneumoniae]|uniref:M20 family metallo-hydrolase n=1 Tax=Klebsiella pneumoniae TaxID=573 RepID=UPI001F1ECFEC|nr:M20 family metallo-hydrolase [Klebsiella pneumoniae]
MSTSCTPEMLRATQSDYQTFDALFALSSRIGATAAGGLQRLTATAEDKQIRDTFSWWLDEQGFTVRVDGIGNLFGLLSLRPDAPWLLCGSHLDSQPAGGRFDGAYGVTAGAVAILSLARQLREQGIDAPFNLAVVSWTNEEGARFQPSLTGSAVFTKKLTLEQGLACRDAQGVTLGEALAAIGYQGDASFSLPLAGYVELHVEQGPHLEQQQTAIGVVQETWAALKWQVTFSGEQNHTGPSLMASRRDALLAAAKTIVAVREEADRHGMAMHSSVGRLETAPNSPNVVTREATLFIEFRSADESLLKSTGESFAQKLQAIARQTATDVRLVSSQLRPRQQLHRGLAQQALACAESIGLSAMPMRSVAGHDAISLSYHCPSCLLFVPSHNGLSHNEAEFTEQADLHAGLDMLVALLGEISLQHAALLVREETPC